MVRDTIARAEEAAARGQLDAVLAALLAVYGAVPAVEVARLVRVVSGRFPLGKPIASGNGRGRFERAEAAANPCDVPTQLAGHGFLADGLAMMATRRPPDPRIADEILVVLARLPKRTREAIASYDPLFVALERTRDPTLAVPLRALRGGFAKLKDRVLRERLAARSEEVARALAARPAAVLGAADARALDALRGAIERGDRAGDAAKLYAEVYANPGEIGPRLVLCDALASTRDPRGELLALQLASAPVDQGRVNAIVRKHRKQLLGDLDRWLRTTGLVFERGFVARGELRDLELGRRPPPQGPEWHTVEALRFDTRQFPLVLEPALRFLRHASWVGLDEACEVAARHREPIGLTSLAAWGYELERACTLLRATMFANLRTLELDVDAARELPAKLAAAVKKSGVTCLRLRVEAAATFAAAPIAGKRIELVEGDSVVRVIGA